MTAQPTPDNPKLAIVTGTTAGIGAEVATQLLAAGWSVIGVARRTTQHDSQRYSHLAADLTDVVSASRRIEEQVSPIAPRPKVVAHRPRQQRGESRPPRRRRTDGRRSATSRLRDQHGGARVADGLRRPQSRGRRPIENRQRVVRCRPTSDTRSSRVWQQQGRAANGRDGARRRVGIGVPHAPQRQNVAIQSYEPGVVETDMQKLARSLPPETFPWGGLFHDFVRRGIVVTPAEPAAEIVAFLEGDDQLGFSEARLS